MKKTTTRQLADYLAMVGLADVRLNPDAGAIPTILRQFQHPTRPPNGLSTLDRALLYSLYSTHQSSVLQVSDMETTVMKRIMRPRIRHHASSGSSKSAIPLWANEVLPQRDAKSIYWYHIGADDGNAAAEFDLGVKYALGQGVPQDYAKAAQWYRSAAQQGYLDAQYNLAIMYANGQGMSRNYAKAAQWFRKAARQGDADAQFDLGVLYADGQGVPQDSVSAFKWWLVAKTDSSFLDDAHDWSANRLKESGSRMNADEMARARREAAKRLAAHRSAP